jgi:hypothetical protein
MKFWRGTGVISQGQARAGCSYWLRPLGTPWMIAATAYAKIWQIFGKLVFDDGFPWKGKVRIAAYLLVI